MVDLDAVRKAYKRRKLRLPLARRFDRNCVLAITAGQIVAATSLHIPIKSIIIGETVFDVGPVAKDIRCLWPSVNAGYAMVATAGVIGFYAAANYQREEEENERAESVFRAAELLLLPSIGDGSMARLIRALDQFKIVGERPYGDN